MSLTMEEAGNEVFAVLENISNTKGKQFAKAVKGTHAVTTLLSMITDTSVPAEIKAVLAVPIATTAIHAIMDGFGVKPEESHEVLSMAKSLDQIADRLSKQVG